MIGSPTMTTGSSAEILDRAKAGDQDAWNELFEECYPKILRVVRRRLSRQMRTHFDSTDIANEVMNSLVLRFGDFNFDSITDLRRFVLHAAQQKVVDFYRHEHAQKRDISRDRALVGDDGVTPWEPAGSSPTPSQVAMAVEEEQQLLDNHSDEHRIAIEMRIQGYSKPEVAKELGWSVRTVERFLKKLADGIRRAP